MCHKPSTGQHTNHATFPVRDSKAIAEGGCVHCCQSHSKHSLTLYKRHQQRIRLCDQQLFSFRPSAILYTAHDPLKTTEEKIILSSSSLFLSYLFSVPPCYSAVLSLIVSSSSLLSFIPVIVEEVHRISWSVTETLVMIATENPSTELLVHITVP